jgi:hypothetical protein
MYYLKHSIWWGPKSVVCCCPKDEVRKGTNAAVEAEMYLSRWELDMAGPSERQPWWLLC